MDTAYPLFLPAQPKNAFLRGNPKIRTNQRKWLLGIHWLQSIHSLGLCLIMTNCLKIQEVAQQSGSLRPELRLEVQFKHALNQATDVVAKYLAQRLIDLRLLRLASQESRGRMLCAGGVEGVAFEFEVEAAAGEAEVAGGAGDVAFMSAQRVGDHAAFEFAHRVGEGGVLAGEGDGV